MYQDRVCEKSYHARARLYGESMKVTVQIKFLSQNTRLNQNDHRDDHVMVIFSTTNTLN